MTQGNWIAIPKGDWGYIHSDNDGSCIAVVTPKGTNEETNANANVMAASKDLLDACEYAESVLMSIPQLYFQSLEETRDENIDMDKIQLAIAKAKGEGGGRQWSTITTES